MDQLKDRIKFIIEDIGITKTEFGRRIGVSQAFVSQLCSGTAKPSDRTIADICRVFNVNEIWLRTGKGNMYSETAVEDAMLATFSEAARSASTAKQRLLRAIARMPEECFPAIEQLLLEMVKENESTKPPET